VKSCQFLSDIHKVSHTEVDEENGHQWAHFLSKQRVQEANNSDIDKVKVFYENNKDQICDRYTIATGKACGGHACIRAFSTGDIHDRLFLGCDRYKEGEKGHITRRLANFNISATLRIWGRENCWVPQEILNAVGFTWNSHDSTDSILILF